MKKTVILTISIIFAVLLISSVSAYFCVSFKKGDKIDFCNPLIKDDTCSTTKCNYCMYSYNETKKCFTTGNPNFCNALGSCLNFYDENSSIDQSAPEITINTPLQKGIYNSRSILFDIELDEEADLYYIDAVNGRGRWTKVCQDCDSYSNKRSFDEGWNNLTFKAVDVAGNERHVNRSFLIDSKKPVIHKTEPREGYANGIFGVQYSEDNLKKMKINYGNNETGMRSKEISGCSSGTKQWCEVSIDLKDYNEEKIKYWFTAEDIAGNIKDSQIKQNLPVDTVFPVLHNPPPFWSYTPGQRYVYFVFNVTELNLDKIEYMDKSASKPSWKNLCSALKNGICATKKSFSRGSHIIDIQITDEAGNAIGSSTGEFEVKY
ncbi:MAG: hypothetical protein PHH54_01140 [Candidatus Nanoarchaeia archaeon]|nr:hypothetical protein [Candidatus Nanoarchaeia archaeon]MDD5740569.1 hypothetical protein [Candidatus Nanoarchaeia archaeon]